MVVSVPSVGTCRARDSFVLWWKGIFSQSISSWSHLLLVAAGWWCRICFWLVRYWVLPDLPSLHRLSRPSSRTGRRAREIHPRDNRKIFALRIEARSASERELHDRRKD